MENKKVKELRELAKEQVIKLYSIMNKKQLIDALIKGEEIPKPYQCIYGNLKYTCKSCKGSKICEHNRQKYLCKDCGGKGICLHNRQKYFCKDCGGKGICLHGKQKYYCREC